MRRLTQPPLTLGPALAWVDVKLNRTWVRSFDYKGFAAREDCVPFEAGMRYSAGNEKEERKSMTRTLLNER